MFAINPEEFIIKVINMIKAQKATMIVEHITYNQIEGKYDSSIFTSERRNVGFDKAIRTKRQKIVLKRSSVKVLKKPKRWKYMQNCLKDSIFLHR